MWALEALAIYLTPFLIIGIAVKMLMKRYGVETIRRSRAGRDQTQTAQNFSPRRLANRGLRPPQLALQKPLVAEAPSPGPPQLAAALARGLLPSSSIITAIVKRPLRWPTLGTAGEPLRMEMFSSAIFA